MTVNRAATLTPRQIDEVVKFIHNNSDTPERDELMFLLSHLAGLRVSEIAKLDIDSAFLDADGRIPNKQHLRVIKVLSNVAKKGHYREVPMHTRIADALRVFLRRYPDLNYIAYAPKRNNARMTVNNLTVWFWTLYKRAGLQNCSSHSGRRSFATRSARTLNQHGQSLRDLQALMGHSRIETTERYIELSDNTHNLVMSL